MPKEIPHGDFMLILSPSVPTNVRFISPETFGRTGGFRDFCPGSGVALLSIVPEQETVIIKMKGKMERIMSAFLSSILEHMQQM